MARAVLLAITGCVDLHDGCHDMSVVFMQRIGCSLLPRVLLPRDARSAKRGIAIVSRPSVYPSVCPSVHLSVRP